jgi:Arc/MetJ-type ribon-helix-helix transcriptional regulator
MIPTIEKFIAEEIASGRYPNREAVIASGVLMLMRERAEAIEDIQKGMEDFRAGRCKPLDHAFADIRASIGLPPETNVSALHTAKGA